MSSFIWDMDGTLVDSYPAIVPAVQEACAEFGMNYSFDYIYEQVIRTSVSAFIEQISQQHGLDPSPVKSRFNLLNDCRIDAIVAIPQAAETLSVLTSEGHSCFVYTHRGASCYTILKNTSLLPYFTEVVTALDGYPRKPAPDAILYLIEKYKLLPSSCFYVGDRRLDVEAAVNAGIGSILYLNPSSPGSSTGKETHIVRSLKEILTFV